MGYASGVDDLVGHRCGVVHGPRSVAVRCSGPGPRAAKVHGSGVLRRKCYVGSAVACIRSHEGVGACAMDNRIAHQHRVGAGSGVRPTGSREGNVVFTRWIKAGRNARRPRSAADAAHCQWFSLEIGATGQWIGLQYRVVRANDRWGGAVMDPNRVVVPCAIAQAIAHPHGHVHEGISVEHGPCVGFHVDGGSVAVRCGHVSGQVRKSYLAACAQKHVERVREKASDLRVHAVHYGQCPLALCGVP